MQACKEHHISGGSETDLLQDIRDQVATRINIEKNPVIEEANKISRKIQNGFGQVRVASEADDDLGFALGCMIARIADKGILEDEARAFREIRGTFCPALREARAPLAINRRTVIDVLRKRGLVPTRQSVRQIKPVGTTPNLAQVASIVERRYRITMNDIIAKGRSKPVVKARFITMWTLRTVSGLSLAGIGDQVGGRDHTSIINGISQVELWRRRDPAFRTETNRISDEADLMGIRANLEVLVQQANRRNTLSAV